MKDTDGSGNNFQFSSKRKNIFDIEREVDKILLKNKDELILKNEFGRDEKQHLSKARLKNFDFNKFSSKNMKKDFIYFVKEQKKPSRKKRKKLKKESDPSVGDKTFTRPNNQIGSLRPEETKWLDERIQKASITGSDTDNKEPDDYKLVEPTALDASEKKQSEVKLDEKEKKKEIASSVSEIISKPKTSDDISDKEIKVESEEVAEQEKNKDASLGESLEKTQKESIESDKADVKSIDEHEIEESKDRDIKKDESFSEEKQLKTSKVEDEVVKEEKPRDLSKEPENKKELSSKEYIESVTPSLDESSEQFLVDDAKQSKDDDLAKSKNESDVAKSPAPSSTEIKLEDIKSDGEVQFLNEANQLKSLTLKNLGYSEDALEEIDFYPLQEPFSYVEIIREKETLDKRYVLIEIGLSERESHILDFVKETLDGFVIDVTELDSNGEEKYLIEKIENIIDEYMIELDDKSKKKIIYFLKKKFLGLDKLEPLMRDPNIEDISCDGSEVPIFLYHRRYGSLKSNIKFNEEEELSAFVIKLAQKCGKHISIAEPMLDATMPDGSRIQMTLSTQVTTKGSTFTIRKFRADPITPTDLIEFHSMSVEMVAYMWMAVENGINALIAGGTAAGKTSTLNAISLFIPRESKIVSIEETREINLPHPNWIPGVVRSGFGEIINDKLVGEIDLFDLMKAALRQRPEYILVGEIRGREAYVLFQAMATGHTTYSTVHADSPKSLIHRLEGKPIDIPRVMLQSLDIVTIQVSAQLGDKRVRRCKQIVEVVDLDPITKEILTNEVFRWDPVEDKFIYSGKSYVLERIRNQYDMSKEEIMDEVKRRVEILNWMRNNNIRVFKDVARIVSSYAETPDELMEKIRKDVKVENKNFDEKENQKSKEPNTTETDEISIIDKSTKEKKPSHSFFKKKESVEEG